MREEEVSTTSGLLNCAGGVVLLVIACIAVNAAAKSNGVCGSGLMDIVLAHIIIYILLVGVIWIMVCGAHAVHPQCMAFYVALMIFLLMAGFGVMTGYSFDLSHKALANPNCTQALIDNSFGLASPVLASLGYTYMALDLAFLLVLACLCCKNCSKADRPYREDPDGEVCGLLICILGCMLMAGLLAFLIIACVTLANTGDVLTACGRHLWDLTTAHVCIYFIIPFVLCGIANWTYEVWNSGGGMPHWLAPTLVVFIIGFVMMTSMSYEFSHSALADSNCTAAMQNHNTPILADIGYAFFVTDMIGSVVFIVCLLVTCSNL